MAGSWTVSTHSCLRRPSRRSSRSPLSADRHAGSRPLPGPAGEPIRVAILGSTGSIGRQAVDVVVALAAHRDVQTLSEQARLLSPRVVAWTAPRSEVGAPDLPPETDAIGGS